MASQPPSNEDVRIEVITDPSDFEAAYDVTANAFGHQTKDGIWMAMNPDWDQPAGKAKNVAQLRDRWQATKAGGNTTFIKATLPDPAVEGSRVIAGLAIWLHASAIPGQGEVPGKIDFTSVYPDNERERRYVTQLLTSLHKNRYEVLRQIAQPESKQKSIMVLDLCVTDPAFQRRGVAKKLVQWGLDEAKRRGDLDAIIEASTMGRLAYEKVGFHQVGEITYDVDEEFRDRRMPPNAFMRLRLPN
ncbi:hypothetical protein PFICI_10086 [Pestalotiopsis fici W106-1]|uniref:N-acetyltransferase domain-containing protein n=1 Tax=Pestalotiopsis fici (strain W106-1 / CGMCC3.15140) TaxID=1229662 RepID=W3WW32_PESFW|nr:uncharacterized protein PFICI_10086 [Pestalotiopsis fici W106-1]ETS78024.1 hypothetical protein PFICI_10086 [Pestalotiopsis fici W106-1]